MNHRNLKCIAFLNLTILLLSACAKELPIDSTDFEQKIVVNGLICPDSIFTVHISSSASISNQITPINSATLNVFENGNFIGTCASLGDGWYQLSSQPSVGKNYKIEVSASGFETVYAETFIPSKVLVSEFTCKVLEGYEYENGYRNTNVVVEFQDQLNTNNYYEIAFYRGADKNYESLYGIRLNVTDESLQADGELSYAPKTYFFSDGLFQNQYKTIHLRNFGESFTDPNGNTTTSPLDIDFKTMSKEYYKYRRSLVIHQFNGNTTNQTDNPINLLFLGDPVDLYTNVTNGYGIFAGYNRTTKPVTYLP